MAHDSHPPIAALIGAVLIAICLLFLLVSIVSSQIQQSMKDFRPRHLEATEAIELAYEYFRRHGRWPTEADFEGEGQKWMPPEWEYESDPEQGGLVMWLHGPYHMALIYRFTPPQQGAVSNTWTLSLEGDKSTFPADVGYSLQMPPESRRP